jgi:hypothetical protein
MRAVLPERPAVDDDAFASSKMHLLSFDLDPTTLPSDALCHLALEMFVSAGLPAGLAEHCVRRFILAVRASMFDNPYHNFYHVFDVMQPTNALSTATGTMARLDAWERFALLSATLCHDMEHPGVTSQFLSKAAGDATRGKYRDIIFRDAVLENHHALRALEFMCDRDVRILKGLSSVQYYQFRSTVSKINLATDITRHGEYLEHLQKFAARRAENPALEMDKQLAMELMDKSPTWSDPRRRRGAGRFASPTSSSSKATLNAPWAWRFPQSATASPHRASLAKHSSSTISPHLSSPSSRPPSTRYGTGRGKAPPPGRAWRPRSRSFGTTACSTPSAPTSNSRGRATRGGQATVLRPPRCVPSRSSCPRAMIELLVSRSLLGSGKCRAAVTM